MKKNRFALTFLMIFLVALFASCSPDVRTPEDNTNNGKDPWPVHESLYGRTFDLMQDNEGSEGQFKAGTVEITNDGDVIIKNTSGNSLLGGYDSLKEMYNAATGLVNTSGYEDGFSIWFKSEGKSVKIDRKTKEAGIMTNLPTESNFTLVETTSSNN